MTGRLTPRRSAALSAAIALVAAIWSVCSIGLRPPAIHMRDLKVGAAATDVIVDAPRSAILDDRAGAASFRLLAKRAGFAAKLMSSDPVRRAVARRAGVPADRLAARTRLVGNFVAALREPDYEQRAGQLVDARKRYAIDVQADPVKPIVHVYARAPTVGEAIRLADAAPLALATVLRSARPAGARRAQLRVMALGRARGAVVNARAAPQIALMTFLVVFALSWALILIAVRARAGWLDARRRPAVLGPRPPWPGTPIATAAGDWPRTTRALPWMVAGFFALLWLVPFNTIQLSVSLPFDLQLDRLVLPVLTLVWVMALAAGATDARRPHLTAVHVAVGAFLAVAWISVVVNAHDLNQAFELDAASKRLVLLSSYGCFFLLVASVIRRSEVPAFLTLTLGLAVLCAIGAVWEYRFHYNVFYALAAKLPDGVFGVAPFDNAAVDDIGRRVTRGPSEHPLELATMLSMALPIALVGLMKVTRRAPWKTLAYGCAACLLVAAALATYRKSALLAPLSVGLTLAWFRRAALLRLAPLAAVSAVVVHVLSPGAFGSIAVQLRPDRLGVGTVTDRAADYDAIRPDLWTHLFFGRGFGSYDHVSYRILDSEILGLLVSVGVVGLACYGLMLVWIVMAARHPAHSTDEATSDAAVAIAAAVVAFGVMSFLFDALAFPHGPYVLLSLAALLAVVLKLDAVPAPVAARTLPRPVALAGPEPDAPAWQDVERPRVAVHAGVARPLAAGPAILVISPVHNEAAHIERVVRAMAAQELAPARWIVRDDGSDDGTPAILRRLAPEVPFLTVLVAQPGSDDDLAGARDRLVRAAEVRNFDHALAAVDWREFTHVMKLDGDVELPPDYLRRVVERFARNPRLGLAGGVLDEPTPGGGVRRLQIARNHVHGALKCYTRACFERIGGIQERLGWDTIDEVYARMAGFQTRSFTDIVAVHHRPLGSASGTLRGHARHGTCAWIAHYPPEFIALRALRVGCRRPAVISGLALVFGYARAAMQGVERVPDPAYRRFARHELRMRMLGALRSALAHGRAALGAEVRRHAPKRVAT